MKYITLEKDYGIKVASTIKKFLAPSKVYLPINHTTKMFVKEGDFVKKGQPVLKYDEVILSSPISGVVMGLDTKNTVQKNEVQVLVIANDYKEEPYVRKGVKKNISDMPKKEILKQATILGTPMSLLRALSKNLDKLVIVGLEDEPYVATEVMIQKEFTKEILDLIDGFLGMMGLKSAEIVIKNRDSENILAYNTYLGTYPNIHLRLVEDYYLLGEAPFLKKYLHYNDSTLFLKPSELIDLYRAVKKNRSIIDITLTISGDAILNPCVIQTKLGTSIIELLSKNVTLKKQEVVYVVNGLMRGKQVDIDNLIVTKDIKSILIMQKIDVPKEKCIRCGKCISICPKNLNPMSMNGKMRQECIHCGLCSYVCPSYIHLEEKWKND